jgi:gluconokinase
MSNFAVRSPFVKVNGVVYFGRMIDKIRTHAEEKLPGEYQANLGKGFDESCVKFLHVAYNDVVDRVAEGGSDEEILKWCFEKGRHPTDEEIYVWNEFMRKRGWNDEITETLKRRKKEAGMAGRSEIDTMFNFIDADEGRFAVGNALADNPNQAAAR